ncbi:hypothetical protein [Vibrio phage phiKT1024]|nr:hypothetical protein [Vibrio phage phiKT1024]
MIFDGYECGDLLVRVSEGTPERIHINVIQERGSAHIVTCLSYNTPERPYGQSSYTIWENFVTEPLLMWWKLIEKDSDEYKMILSQEIVTCDFIKKMYPEEFI